MRGAINVIAAAGGSIQSTAGTGSDFQDVGSIAPTPVFLGGSQVAVAGGAGPTNAVITLVQAVPGIGASAAVFDDEFVSAPWQAHRTWQTGDMWSYTATFDTAGNGLQEGPSWWANPIATPAAATVYPAPSNSLLSLGLMATPANTPNPGGGTITQTTIGTLMNNQLSPGGLRLFGYHELRVKVPKVPGFLFQWDIEDYPSSATWTTEIDLIIYTDAAGVGHVIFQLAAPSIQPIYSTTTIDITQFHTYGLNWQADHITAYIDNIQVGAIPTPTGDYQSKPMFAYLLTSDASYQGFNAPSLAALPAFAQIDYYRVFSNIPTTSGTVLVHGFNAGGSANTITDSVGQTWLRHPDARVGSPPLLTALAVNTKPMPQGATITVGFINPGANTQASAAAWYVPYVNATAFGTLVNVGQSGAVPNAPTITATATSSSTASVFVTLPTTGPVLDTGAIQVQYRQTGTTTWNAAPAPPKYITPDHGSLLDAFGNVWTISGAGASGQINTVMCNGAFANGYNVTQMQQIGNTIYQVNAGGNWYSFIPSAAIPAASAGSVTWTSFGTTSPLLTVGVSVTGLTSLAYDFSAYISNSAGFGALSNVVPINMPLAQGPFAISDTGSATAWMNHTAFAGTEYTGPLEAQYYASPTRTPGFTPFSGTLNITADTVVHTVFNPSSLAYNSGALVSVTETGGAPAAGLFSAQYFYFAVYAKLPAGRGLWPGIRLKPRNPTSPGSGVWDGEIDVMEAVGQDTAHISQTVRYAASDGLAMTLLSSNAVANGPRSASVLVSNYSIGFHEYAVDWQATGITWYIDGVATASYPATAPFTNPGNPFYLLLNLAVGAAGSPPGPPDGTTVFPAQVQYGYIRVAASRSAYVAGTYTDLMVNAGVPNAPTIAQVSVGSTSAVVSITPPVAGQPLDHGKYQIQYITTGAYTDNGPAIQYITPDSGSLTDSFGNVWTISAAGTQGQTNTVMCNGAFANGYNVPQMMLAAGAVYQVNSSAQWFSYTPSAGSIVGANVIWAAASASPLASVSIAGLAAVTTYQMRDYVTNSAGAGPPSAAIPVTTAAVQTITSFRTYNSGSVAGFNDLNGNPVVLKGVHVWTFNDLSLRTGNLAANGGDIFGGFPRTKIIRMHNFWGGGNGDYPSPAAAQTVINYFTNRGVVLIFGAGDYQFTYGQSLISSICGWQNSFGIAYANNPYVWFEGPNEPVGSQSYIDTVSSQMYSAIRNVWLPNTYYEAGMTRNNGGNLYRQNNSSGTSAAGGGPAGTGSSITDGSCSWSYVSAAVPGCSSPIGFCTNGPAPSHYGGCNIPSGSVLANMVNVWGDVHEYVGNRGSTVQSYVNVCNADIAIMQGQGRDRNGLIIPICSMETGDSEGGSSQDSNYGPCLTAFANGTVHWGAWCAFLICPTQSFGTPGGDVLNSGTTPLGFGPIAAANM